MDQFLTALYWLLAANLWVAFGCVVLVVAIDKMVVKRPHSVLQSIFWMSMWPVLLVKVLQALIGRNPAPAACSPGPARYNQSNSVN